MGETDQLNGFGHRLNKAEGDLREENVRSLRNEFDIRELWNSINEIKISFTALSVRVALIVGAGMVCSVFAPIIISLIRGK